MRRNDQPSRPNAMTCSRFSLLKTWLMTTEGNFPLRQLCLKPSLYGRFSLDHLWPLLGDHRGLLKRGINGTYVSIEPFHLFRYLDEQSFRYNNRATAKNPLNDSDRFSLVTSQFLGKRLTFAELPGKGLET